MLMVQADKPKKIPFAIIEKPILINITEFRKTKLAIP